jgi:hypothetical protein
MSHSAFIYGLVTSPMAGADDWQKYHRLNSLVIEQLPEKDSYPPLSKPMFAITQGPMISWQSQAIHFGWTTKNFECDVVAWIEKFESLLMKLYWWEARVQMELEIYGKVEIQWEIDGESVTNWQNKGLDVPNQWNRTIVADAGIPFSKSSDQTA